jgi:hypothetical protein
MQKENKVYNITPANRVGSVQEYYFSRKLKEVAEMNAAGKNVINLPIFPLRNRQSRHCVNMLVSRTNMVISRM